MIFDIYVADKAKELGLKRRTEEEMTKMKPGYYMDTNGNLSIINKVKVLKDKKRGTGLDIDADIYGSGSLIDDMSAQTCESIIHWEFLGDL